MARSSWFFVLACGGCDFAFGLTDDPAPCQPASFETARVTDITNAEQFSVDWDQKLAIVAADGMTYQLALPDGAPVPIDLGPYSGVALSLAPEGDALFYTATVEPAL